MIGDQRLLSSRKFVVASPVFRPNRLVVRLQILLYLLISGLLFAVPYDYALAWLGIAAVLVLLCVTHRVSLRALLRRLWPVAVPVGMLTLFLALSGPGTKTPQAIRTDNAGLHELPVADRSLTVTGAGTAGVVVTSATAWSVERSRMFPAIPSADRIAGLGRRLADVCGPCAGAVERTASLGDAGGAAADSAADRTRRGHLETGTDPDADRGKPARLIPRDGGKSGSDMLNCWGIW